MDAVDDYRDAVLALAAPLGTVTVPLAQADGCVLARDVVATFPLPRFDMSAMDGYAVRAADTPGTLTVSATSSAGHPGGVTASGTAVRILTGGELPPGADAVVPVEDTDGGTDTVTVHRAVEAGAYIRRTGEELPAGAVVVAAGRLVGPGQLAAAATAGAARLEVVRRPRVALVSTGDELVPVGEPLGPGQLYDSNGPGLAAAVRAAGGEVVHQQSAVDDAERLATLLADLAGDVDVVMTSGGISAGAEFDAVKVALLDRVTFTKVAMQPGMPQASGRLGDAIYLGFPGNPVSVLVSFLVFGRPVLRRLRGLPPVEPRLQVTLGAPVDGLPGKTRFVRAQVDSTRCATPVGGHGSHLVAGLAAADVLLVVPPSDESYAAGTSMEAIPLGEVL